MSGGLDVLKETLSVSNRHRAQPEMELIDEVVVHENAIKWPGTKLQETVTGLFERRHTVDDVPFDKGCVPSCFAQVVEATYFGMLFIWSAQSPFICGYAADRPS